jgi:hypothetical protein
MWTYKENFESFTLGNLNGQNNWSVVNGIANIIDGSYIGKCIELTPTTYIGGLLYARVRLELAEANRTSSGKFIVAGKVNSVNGSWTFGVGTTTSVFMFNVGKSMGQNYMLLETSNIIGIIVPGEWFLLNVEFTTTQVRARLKISGTWTNWTNWVNLRNTGTARYITSTAGNPSAYPAVKTYLDSIVPALDSITNKVNLSMNKVEFEIK